MVFDSYLKIFLWISCSLSLPENQILSSEGLKFHAVTFILLAEWITWLRYVGKWSDSSKFHRYKPPQGFCCNIQWFIWQLFACNKCLQTFPWNSGQFPWWRQQKKSCLGEFFPATPWTAWSRSRVKWGTSMFCMCFVSHTKSNIPSPVHHGVITTVNNTWGIIDETLVIS